LGQTIIRSKTEIALMTESYRAYVLVEIQPGKENEFSELISSRESFRDSTVERMDFVHGSFDFVITLNGTLKDIDKKIMEIRQSPFLRKTETLICFDLFNWADLTGRLDE
jgi:hypothetical protein